MPKYETREFSTYEDAEEFIRDNKLNADIAPTSSGFSVEYVARVEVNTFMKSGQKKFSYEKLKASGYDGELYAVAKDFDYRERQRYSYFTSMREAKNSWEYRNKENVQIAKVTADKLFYKKV